MRLYHEGRLFVVHFIRDQNKGGVINGHIWHGLVTCWIHEGECVMFHGCNAPLLAKGEARCSRLDVFKGKKGYLLAFRRAVDTLTAYFDERNRGTWTGEYATLVPVNLRSLRASLWAGYTKAIKRQRRQMVQAPINLKEADKILDRLGMFLLSKGDKKGWAICDDARHVLRGQGKVDLV